MEIQQTLYTHGQKEFPEIFKSNRRNTKMNKSIIIILCFVLVLYLLAIPYLAVKIFDYNLTHNNQYYDNLSNKYKQTGEEYYQNLSFRAKFTAEYKPEMMFNYIYLWIIPVVLVVTILYLAKRHDTHLYVK